MNQLAKYLIALFFAAVMFGNPVKSSADNDSGHAGIQTLEPVIATTAYCYAGKVIAPDTGEQVELYKLCTDNWDFA